MTLTRLRGKFLIVAILCMSFVPGPSFAHVEIPPLEKEEPLVMMVLQEANGEPIRGMVAVAAVALDRVHDPRWPDTLEGVLYQRKQFSGLHHNYRRKDYSDAEIAQARKAVIRATMGERPCGFEVFWYHADWINVPMWARDQMQMTPACHVGDHLFYRHVRGDEDD